MQAPSAVGSSSHSPAPSFARRHASAPGQGSVEAPPVVHDVLASPGQAMDDATRAFMETRFGRDFGGVRLHVDPLAVASAHAMDASAYTVGTHVVFGEGQYAPASLAGRKLLAHELAHVAQQSDATRRPTVMRKPAGGSSPPSARLEPVPRAPVSGEDCSATSTASFEAQPPALQAVLRRSYGESAPAWFDGLGEKRHILTSIYIRLCNYGLWSRVTTVGNVYSGERPFLGFDVPGSVGHVDFTSDDTHALMIQLLDTFRFCADHGIGGSQHPGQASFREVGESDSLHIAVGPGSHFDAHIDRYSPVTGGASGLCVYDPALAHFGREVFPAKFRSKFGIPGVQIFPEPAGILAVPGAAPGREESAPPPILGLTWRF